MVAYVDDAVVATDSFGEMLVNLQTVLNRYRQDELKLRPEKCFLFQHEIEFCGYVISQAGRRVANKRAACLNELEFPTNIHQLRRLVGFFSYNRLDISINGKN